jgi:hypothetical protein
LAVVDVTFVPDESEVRRSDEPHPVSARSPASATAGIPWDLAVEPRSHQRARVMIHDDRPGPDHRSGHSDVPAGDA